MKIQNLKKGIASLALGGSLILGAGAFNIVDAQGRHGQRRERREERREHRQEHRDHWRDWRDRRAERIEHRFERRELDRIRQFDHQRRLRYHYDGGNRIVGYYDRFGEFHAVGYYDRYGQYWRFA